jgi:chromosome partitioning protein
MKTMTFLAQKGGAGKSTLATQLAVYAVQAGEVACLIDIDPQGSAFVWKSIRDANTPMVLKALPDRLPEMIASAAGLGVTLVLVDTPPHTDKAAIEVIRATDFILCPTRPELFSLSALADTARLLDLTKCKDKALAVINDLPANKKARENALRTAVAQLKRFDLKIADTTISHSDAIVAAIADGKGITEKLPNNASSKEIRGLWAEINEKWPLLISPPTMAGVTA